MSAVQQILHASAVAVQGRGLLIMGPSGSGKSGLALEMIALGAVLVADDRTEISLRDGSVWLDVPVTIRGLIEARGIGIVQSPAAGPTPLAVVVDLSQTETKRLPPKRETTLLGQPFPLVHKAAHPSFAAGLMAYLLGGRKEDT
ncbi:MAG: HPr kinase/phosphatase C-terminal domain-containing protein [Pelagimonas sp.]|jgi:HPr kinase/phosphorylase|nr:HPr kinase/phosphatase C-terminal domain-containing protein [Pelagimonas sp.]